ncbi:MAG: redox-regulated ATPase YchF [Chloroflexi bacterium]|nr:redox-regulated ATPase YchF [Chloroflexota bacterium]
MQVGILGLPLSGKTTIFNALTRSKLETSNFAAARFGVSTAIIDVLDSRVDLLSGLFNPRKTIYAKIQFNDISGVSSGQAASGTGLDAQLLNAASKCDALLLVVRGFENDQVPAVDGKIDPRRDLEALLLELVFSDLVIVEHRIERIEEGLKKAKAIDRPNLEHELALMRRLTEALEQGQTVADVELTAEEQVFLRSFQFLTAKPLMVVNNVSEGSATVDDLSWAAGHRATSALVLQGALEAEIAQLPPEEVVEFLGSYNIAEPGLNRLVRECYALLGMMSFFTVGEDEVRAWTVERNASALDAARAIHSDLARGFIRAEVISYADMIACKTMAEARRLGKLRLEGRDYAVQDGDIVHIRFSV